MAFCTRCGTALDGHLAHALGWCSGCDGAPGDRDVTPNLRHHGFIVAPRCMGQGPEAGACRGALRWSGPASDGDVLCEAHWLVAEGYDHDAALPQRRLVLEPGRQVCRCPEAR